MTTLDTAMQRPATGLDSGARTLILNVLVRSGFDPVDVVDVLFEDRYGSRADYYAALGQVWGSAVGYRCEQAVSNAEVNAQFPVAFGGRGPQATPSDVGAHTLLMTMPEPDFRLAVEEVVCRSVQPQAAGERITKICRGRGAPWIFAHNRFDWVGEQLVERELLDPALTALSDRRFAGGVRSEFESARNELRAGTAVARKQAVYEAGCAVESAMKVLLDERGIAYDKARDVAQKLFTHLVAAGVVPSYMERTLLAAAQPRNKTAGHGAGAIAHDVSTVEAEAVVAAAAGAIAYLGQLLP